MPRLPVRDFDYLDRYTPDGLFSNRGGEHFWVIHDHTDVFAVRLNAFNGCPPFSFIRLGDEPSGVGFWRGELQLCLQDRNEQLARERCGIIVARGIRYYLKANSPDGTMRRIMILPYKREGEDIRRSKFFSSWSLVFWVAGQGVKIFQSRAVPPALCSYGPGWEANYKSWNPMHLRDCYLARPCLVAGD